MKILLFLSIFIFSFGYKLITFNIQEAQKLNNLGFLCNLKDKNYVCLQSKNIKELKKIQNMLLVTFNIQTKIINDSSKKSLLKNKKHNNKNNFCIQVDSFKNFKNAKFMYQKLNKYPFARIEKINNFYVLRIGEGNLKSIDKIHIKIKGIVRKCDIIPKRIIISNFKFK